MSKTEKDLKYCDPYVEYKGENITFECQDTKKEKTINLFKLVNSSYSKRKKIVQDQVDEILNKYKGDI